MSELTSNGIQKVHTCNALEDSFHNAGTCIENDILEASSSLDPTLNWNNITEEKVNPSSTSPALSDSWIMLDFNESNADGTSLFFLVDHYFIFFLKLSNFFWMTPLDNIFVAIFFLILFKKNIVKNLFRKI